MVEASTEFRKNSFNDADSARLAKVATVFQNVADESISAGESASFIIAQMKAFNVEANNAEHIIDAVNAVSNNYAVSSGDLANSLGNMSATMSIGNNTFEESLGMLTAMTEITQNATKGSRALVTIQSRLNQIVDESSSTGKALAAWYAKNNIATKDAEGQMRSLYKVLGNVAKIWPKLTKNEQTYYLQQQAGTNQTQNLASLLSNYSTAINATETALYSAGSAMKENEKYMEGLEAKEAILKAEFEDFSNRVLSDEFVGSLIDAGSQLLEFANTDVGIAMTRIAGISATITSAVAAIGSLYAKLSSLKNIAGARSFLGTVLSPKSLLIIGGISAAIVGIAEAVDYFNKKSEESKLDNLIEVLGTQKEELKETEQGYIDAKKRLAELNETPYADRTVEMSAEIEQLEKQIKAYEHLLELKQQEYYETGNKLSSDGKVIVGSRVIDVRGRENLTDTQMKALTAEYSSAEDAVESLFIALENLISQQTKVRYETAVASGDFAEAYNIARTELEGLGFVFQDVTESFEIYGVKQGNILRATIDDVNEFGDSAVNIQQVVDSTRDVYDALMLLPESQLTDWQEEFIKNWEFLNKKISDAEPSVEIIGEEMDEISTSAQNAISALQAYAESADNISANNISLTNSLFDTNGNLSDVAKSALTADSALASLATDTIKARQVQSQADFSTLILSLQQVGNAATLSAAQIANMMAMAGINIGGLTDAEASASLQKQYYDLTGKTALGDQAGYTTWVQDYLSGKAQSNYNAKMQEYTSQLAQLSLYTPSTSGRGSSSSSKKAQAQVINTIEELREYLTDESTRLKLLNPETNKADLTETITSMTDMYQEYQSYLQQLVSQGFDKTSDEYKDAEKEWSEFLEALLEKFKAVIEKGDTSIKELVKMITDSFDEIGVSADSLISNISSGLNGITVGGGSFDPLGNINAYLDQVELERDSIHSAFAALRDAEASAAASAIKNSQAESEVADSVAKEYERQNELLEDKIALEEKLEAIERAKQRRMLVYSEGRFQYMQDVDAISEAQTAYDTTYRGIEQRQIQDLLGMLGENSSAFFSDWVSKRSGSASPLRGYESALQAEQMKYIRENIAGTVFEDLSDSELHNIFGEAMKPGEAFYQYQEQLDAIATARDELEEKNEKRRQEIREKNVLAQMEQGVTDFGQKILESESQEEAAYWADLRNTKLAMIERDKQLYGDEYASKTWGTATSESGSWKSNEDLYQEKWSKDGAFATTTEDFHRQHYDVPSQEYTTDNPELDAAKYNVVSGLTFDRYPDDNNVLSSKIFGERITKSELQELYDSDMLSDTTKGYILNLAHEMNEAGYPGYGRGTRNARGGISMVGENGPELRVLNQGDGILPSNITDNLWRWGSLTPNEMLGSLVNKSRDLLQTLNVNNVTLPNVRDATSFVSGLRQLANQYVTRRN